MSALGPPSTLPRHEQVRRGLAYPFAGIRWVLGHPSTWPLVGVPVALNVGLLLAGAWLAWSLAPALLAVVWAPGPHTPWLLQGVWLATAYLLRALAFLVLGVAMYFAAGFVAIPFNDRLSERVEADVVGADALVGSTSWWGDLAVSVAHSLLALVLWAVAMVALFALNLVPGIGSLLAFPLSVLATAVFLAREMIDGPLSRRRLSFLAKLRVLAAHAPRTVPFGLAVALLLWVPGLNFLMMPMAVAGGTLLVLDLERGR